MWVDKGQSGSWASGGGSDLHWAGTGVELSAWKVEVGWEAYRCVGIKRECASWSWEKVSLLTISTGSRFGKYEWSIGRHLCVLLGAFKRNFFFSYSTLLMTYLVFLNQSECNNSFCCISIDTFRDFFTWSLCYSLSMQERKEYLWKIWVIQW